MRRHWSRTAAFAAVVVVVAAGSLIRSAGQSAPAVPRFVVDPDWPAIPGDWVLGEVSSVGSPLRFDGERADADLPPPALGEHTAEVLSEFGVEAGEIERLRSAGVVA